MNIQEFISKELETSFDISINDCCHTCDRWVFDQTGISPMQDYGISYLSEEESKSLLKKEKGILVGISEAMNCSGFMRTKNPSVGDVGIILFDDKIAPAIYTGSSWFTRHKDGFVDQVNPKVLRIWKIG